jgi:hypothetical protein
MVISCRRSSAKGSGRANNRHAVAQALGDGPPAVAPNVVPCVVEFPQELEVHLDVLGRRGVRQAQRPAQGQPGALDPVSQRHSLAVFQRRLQHGPQARAACLPVGREALQPARIRQQAGHGGRVVLQIRAGQQVQVRQRQPA